MAVDKFEIGKTYYVDLENNTKGVLVRFREETKGIGFKIEGKNPYLYDNDGLTYFDLDKSRLKCTLVLE